MKKLIVTAIIVDLTFAACKPTQKQMIATNSLEGNWELNYITGPRIAFNGLYPDKKPTITFDLKQNKVTGNNSCNQYFGNLKVDGKKVNFKDAKMGMTMMACQGDGDTVYMNTLEKIDWYSISEDGKTLTFNMGEMAMMRFDKK